MTARWPRSRWPHGIQREPDDPLRWPCPICGAPETYACLPLRATGYDTILRPHRERGAMPWVLERDGYTQDPDTHLWARPARRRPRSDPSPA